MLSLLPNVGQLSVVLLRAVTNGVIMLSDVMICIFILSVIMLNVAAPSSHLLKVSSC